ncbi:MAG: hypothetical protein QN193_01165 [Armatimonadota bacterium]|nr:hypothetical protein [Armatimonadota bacterium]MDR7569200.1 hypothetical protein [Armatimonadota bacterium]MDR7613318.1 hypothetical protein [Armatimonadota bacterium]
MRRGIPHASVSSGVGVRLEDLRPQATVRGVLPGTAVTVVNVQWFGTDALELTYKDPAGRVGNVLLYRDDEPRLEVVEAGRPWSFDGHGALLFLDSRGGPDAERKEASPP